MINACMVTAKPGLRGSFVQSLEKAFQHVQDSFTCEKKIP